MIIINGIIPLNLPDDRIDLCSDMDLTNMSSRSVMEKNGWKFYVSPWGQKDFIDICGNDTWYGFYRGSGKGIVSTRFEGSGIGTLNFGNCWNHNEVAVYLNNYKISYAVGGMSKKEIQFRFFPGDKLQVTEDGAIIKLHSLSITCYCKYTFYNSYASILKCILYNI